MTSYYGRLQPLDTHLNDMRNHILMLYKHVLYSAKRWQWKTLANLVNLSELAKILPTKVLPSI